MQCSEQDFAGTNAKVQMALLYVSGFRDQDATLRTALQLLRRKYRLIEHVIATVVRPFSVCLALGLHSLVLQEHLTISCCRDDGQCMRSAGITLLGSQSEC